MKSRLPYVHGGGSRREALQAACVYPVAPGIEVFTNTPKARKARRVNLELILSNHNRECTPVSAAKTVNYRAWLKIWASVTFLLKAKNPATILTICHRPSCVTNLNACCASAVWRSVIKYRKSAFWRCRPRLYLPGTAGIQ